MESGDFGDGLPAWARRVAARGVADALAACVRRAADVQSSDEPADSTDSAAGSSIGLAAPMEREPTCRFTVPADAPRLAVWFSPSLAEAVLDVLLGGDGLACKPRGPLTALDRQLLGPLTEQIAARLAVDAPAAVSTAGEAATCSVTLNVRLDGPPLAMQLVWPHDVRSLARALLPQAEHVELAAVIHEPADPADLANLADGDLLVSDVVLDGEILVTIAGTPQFAATLGQYNGKRAVTLTRKL